MRKYLIRDEVKKALRWAGKELTRAELVEAVHSATGCPRNRVGKIVTELDLAGEIGVRMAGAAVLYGPSRPRAEKCAEGGRIRYKSAFAGR